MTARQPLDDKLAPFGQQHVLQHWDSLAEAKRERLASQIEGVDLAQLAALFKGDVDQPDWDELSRRAEPPVAMRVADRLAGRDTLGGTPTQATARGKQALAAGSMGVIVVAGGQGSRLGFDHPKGMFPIGPVTGATLMEIHLSKALAIGKKYNTRVPVYVMTSPVTHDEQVEFLREHKNFGLADDDVILFCQGTMPAVDDKTGKLLLESPGELFLSPNGHGGMVAALADSGALDHMRRRGIEHLFYLQVDNPLVPIGDAELLGYHLLAESELTSIAVAKATPGEKLGNFVMIDDRLHVIEYSDFPADVAEQKDKQGGLKFWAGSIAIHIFERTFFERAIENQYLPFHVAHKKVPFIDEQGKLLTPTENNALKFERFIFDLLPQARRPIVVEYAEEDCFAPLKNASGAPKDTKEYVQQFLVDQHRRWLEAAGAQVAAGATVEISPLWGVDAESVAKRVTAGMEVGDGSYLTI